MGGGEPALLGQHPEAGQLGAVVLFQWARSLSCAEGLGAGTLPGCVFPREFSLAAHNLSVLMATPALYPRPQTAQWPACLRSLHTVSGGTLPGLCLLPAPEILHMPWTLYSPLAGLFSSSLVGFNNHSSLASLGSTGLETPSSASGNSDVHTLAPPIPKHQVLCRQMSKHWIHLFSKSWLVLMVSEVGGCSACSSCLCLLGVSIFKLDTQRSQV